MYIQKEFVTPVQQMCKDHINILGKRYYNNCIGVVSITLKPLLQTSLALGNLFCNKKIKKKKKPVMSCMFNTTYRSLILTCLISCNISVDRLQSKMFQQYLMLTHLVPNIQSWN